MGRSNETMGINELKPGRELDALIAEKVMEDPFRKPTHGTTCQRCGKHYDECGDMCYYSTDIAAAWAVVEKLVEKGLTMIFEWKGADREYPLTAEVSFSKGWDYGHAVSDSAPDAICLAALEAVNNA